MRGLLGLFKKSPWKPLLTHMEKSYECVNLLRPMTDAFVSGDYEEVERIFKQVTKLEHEADLIKDQIRDAMPRSLLMAVDRRDFLNLLARQDAIPDCVEDIGMLYMLRKTQIPAVLKQNFDDLVDAAIKVVDWNYQVLKELDSVVQASFSGAPAKKMYQMIDEIGKLEHDADVAAFRFARRMYAHEDQFSPVDIYMLSKIERGLGSIANAAEAVCKSLRLILAQ